MERVLDENQLEEYKTAFALFDRNSDGIINRRELESLMCYLGQILDSNTADYIQDQCGHSGSTDHSVNCTFPFFIRVMEWKLRYGEDNNYEGKFIEACKAIDKDKSGRISEDEFRHELEKYKNYLGPMEYSYRRSASKNEDGTINYRDC